MDDEGVFRVQFSPLSAAREQDDFYRRLKELGGMVVYGVYPAPLVIGIAADAAARLAELPYVETVESVTDDYAVGG